MKKRNVCFAVLVITLVLFSFYYEYQKRQSFKLTSLQLANIEALAQEENRPPEWWDFFNNYEVEERIPVNTSNCKGGYLYVKGTTIYLGSCHRYTMAIYHHCYDGGKRDECTSSHLQGYI